MYCQYWRYQDDNAFFNIQGKSFWELLPEIGIWGGVDLSTITSSEPSDFYWTPYWNQRVLAVLRYLQVWHGYTFRFDLMGGYQREDKRPIRRPVEENFVGDSDWELVWGASATYNKHLGSYLELLIDGTVMAMRDYIDHRFMIGLSLGF